MEDEVVRLGSVAAAEGGQRVERRRDVRRAGREVLDDLVLGRVHVVLELHDRVLRVRAEAVDCRELRDRLGAALPVLFVSGTKVDAIERVAGLLVGGDDYLVKPFGVDELVARVRATARRAAGNGETRALTRREREILGLLADGLTQAEIAERLVISPTTVRTHIEHILPKLRIHSRAQAVAVAFRDGLAH